MSLFASSLRFAFGNAFFVPASYSASRATDPTSIVFQRIVGDQPFRWSHADRPWDPSKFKTLYDLRHDHEFQDALKSARNHREEVRRLETAPYKAVALAGIGVASGMFIAKFLGSERPDTESRAV